MGYRNVCLVLNNFLSVLFLKHYNFNLLPTIYLVQTYRYTYDMVIKKLVKCLLKKRILSFI